MRSSFIISIHNHLNCHSLTDVRGILVAEGGRARKLCKGVVFQRLETTDGVTSFKMLSFFFFTFFFLCLSGCCRSLRSPRAVIRVTKLRMHETNGEPISERTAAFQSASKNSKSLSVLAISLLSFLKAEPAFAFGALENANQKLSTYGLPPIIFIPNGLSPIVSEYGRGNSREKMENPILVQFCHPSLWVVATTSVNTNGEAGTVSANDYIKGDSAFLFTMPLKGETLSVDNKALISKFIIKSLSQKGDPLESFIVGTPRLGPVGVNGQQYILADISYSLNTEAGFLIARKGVVSVCSVGPQMQGLISVTTGKRWKTLENSLRDVADSFRVYKLDSGIFSTL